MNECNEYQEKTTYGLYQYRTISIHIWIISIQDYTHNERVKRVLYTIYQQMKRYNHFNTTIYHTGQEQDYKTLSTYFNSTTYRITTR